MVYTKIIQRFQGERVQAMVLSNHGIKLQRARGVSFSHIPANNTGVMTTNNTILVEY